MAAIQSFKKTLYEVGEIVYGTLTSGTPIVNATYDLPLSPGYWNVSLFVNSAALVGATIAVAPLDAGDNLLAAFPLFPPSGVAAANPSIAAVTTTFMVNGNNPNSVTLGDTRIPVYKTVRVTIAGASVGNNTNRIDFIATKVG